MVSLLIFVTTSKKTHLHKDRVIGVRIHFHKKGRNPVTL